MTMKVTLFFTNVLCCFSWFFSDFFIFFFLIDVRMFYQNQVITSIIKIKYDSNHFIIFTKYVKTEN